MTDVRSPSMTGEPINDAGRTWFHRRDRNASSPAYARHGSARGGSFWR